MRRFLRRIGEGGGPLAVINPASLSPFLYVNSLTGLTGTTDGSLVALWPDEGGAGHDITQVTNAEKPTMRRSGLSVSANGGPTVQFQGTDVNPSNMGRTVALPSEANGWDVLFYGRFYSPPVGNSFNGSVLWQDNTGGRPQCGYYTAGGGLWFERDDLGTRTGSAFPIGSVYGLIRWKFVPSGPLNGTLTAGFNGGSQLSVPYQFNAALSGGFGIGCNQTQVVATKMDLCSVVWYAFNLTPGQVAGITNFWRHQFG